ncbi:MAG TPA: iron-sulfur cluster carrier protein ApbC [Stellaceae bacterium]|nr:iron-sulfur cluster carrier protein ApbC [Stellaceae bacterium]
MAAVTERQILDALSQVRDPDKGRDIVSLDMVSGMVIRDGNVGFAIEVEPERGPRLEPLRKAAEAAVEALPGVVSVTAVLTAESRPPAGRPAPHAHAHPHAHGAPQGGPAAQAQRRGAVPGVGAIIAVASGKGGVGKSTVAANLALGLQANGLKVGVLDADIYGPSMPRMLGISGKPTMIDAKTIRPMENYGLECMSIGFLVPEDTAMIWRGPMVMSALNQMLRDVAWGELDIMVVDLPPGTGDAQLTMAQQVPLAGAVIVSTPQDIALIDARRGLSMFEKVDVPVLGIIENMSYFLCPHCGERSEIFSHGGARREAERLGCEFLGEVPLDLAIRETSDEGRPVTISDPGSPHALLFREIAAKVWAKVSSESARRAPPRIVIE